MGRMCREILSLARTIKGTAKVHRKEITKREN